MKTDQNDLTTVKNIQLFYVTITKSSENSLKSTNCSVEMKNRQFMIGQVKF